MKKTLSFMAMLAISTPVFSATLESLSKEQLVKAFVNKTSVSISTDVYNGQIVPNTFSFYLDDKGNVKGQFGVKPKNGPQMDTGVYKIEEDGAMYVTWQHMYDGKKVCFRLFDTDNAYVSVDCNNVFHTAYLKNAIKEGNQIK